MTLSFRPDPGVFSDYQESSHRVRYMSADRMQESNIDNLKPLMLKIIGTACPNLFETAARKIQEGATSPEERSTDEYSVARQLVNTINKYMSDIASKLKADYRDNYDYVYAAQFIAQKIDQDGVFPSPEDVQSELSAKSFKKPEKIFTETEGEREARVKAAREEQDRLRETASKEGRVKILLPIDETRQFRMKNGELKIHIDSDQAISKFFTGKHDNYTAREHGILGFSELNAFLAESISADQGPNVHNSTADTEASL